MDVLSLFKGFYKYRVFGHMRHDPELYLGVVRRKDKIPRPSSKGLPYPPSEFGPYRHVLKVWLAGGEPPCGCNSLIEGRMDSSCLRIYHRREGIYICGLELGKRPVRQYLGR